MLKLSVLITFILANSSSWAQTKLVYSDKLAKMQTQAEDPIELIYKESLKQDEDKIDSEEPVINYALKQIEKVQQKKKSSVSCKECTFETKNLKFQQCSTENNYLEGILNGQKTRDNILGDIINSNISIPPIIKSECVRIGLETKFGENSRSFRTCSSSSGAMERAYRPCVSENYFNLINNSINLVGNCMKDYLSPDDRAAQVEEVRSVFAMLAIESGLHINAMSGSGAAGIGQFTQSAISAVNRLDFQSIKNHLGRSNEQACRQLGEQVLKSQMESSKSKSCGRISIKDGNPLKNLIYTFSYLKISRDEINQNLLEQKRYRNKFKLSAQDYSTVERALTVWSHNTGGAGLWTPVRALLNSKYANRPVTDPDTFLEDVQKAMKKFPARANRSKSRRSETSRYWQAINTTLERLEKNVGGGSCVRF